MVSPICFLSCRSKGPCQVHLSLPHAVDISQEGSASRIVILSTATAKIDADTQSPFFSPSERVLAPLENVELELKMESVKFETDLHHPSLFAVAVRDGPGSIPLPLRCCMYVLYPLIDQTISMVTGFDVEAYIGMNVATVATVSNIYQYIRTVHVQEIMYIPENKSRFVTFIYLWTLLVQKQV